MENTKTLPSHIGFIMDGNRRWASGKRISINKGHLAGYRNVIKIANICKEKGIKIITIYAFSTENNSRPSFEINDIFDLFKKGIIENMAQFIKDSVKLNIIGNRENLPLAIRKLIVKVEEKTKNGKKNIINVAFNYGGRAEITDSVKKAIANGDQISEETISNNLYTKNMPDPDLIIRTGGQKRLSNFMIWQSAYAELYFIDCLWPDFDEHELNNALNFYKKAKRNFGA